MKISFYLNSLILVYSCNSQQIPVSSSRNALGSASGYVAPQNPNYNSNAKWDTNSKLNSKSPLNANTNNLGPQGQIPSSSSSGSNLYNRNRLISQGPDTAPPVQATHIPVGGSVSCSVHINRPSTDLCAYDFCGSAATNSQISSSQYTTATALISALKAQGQMPNPCTNASVINALVNLQILDLSHQNISDLSALTMMTNVRTLNLDFNSITDLSALMGMTQLQYLSANNNQLTNFTGIATLPLKEIYVANNQITSVNELASINTLSVLDIRNNQVSSIVALLTHSIEIYVAGNPGIITEARSMPKPVLRNDGNCTTLLNDAGGNLGSSCFLGSLTVMFGGGMPSRKNIMNGD